MCAHAGSTQHLNKVQEITSQEMHAYARLKFRCCVYCDTYHRYTSPAAGERQHGGASHSSTDPEYARKRKDYIAKQQRWLLFLRHCAKCQSADNACQYGQSCAIAKQLWRHILTCSDGNCTYSRWEPSRPCRGYPTSPTWLCTTSNMMPCFKNTAVSDLLTALLALGRCTFLGS